MQNFKRLIWGFAISVLFIACGKQGVQKISDKGEFSGKFGISADHVDMLIGETQELIIRNGSGDYEVTDDFPGKFVTLDVTKSKIKITPVSEGETTIIIIDRKRKAAGLSDVVARLTIKVVKGEDPLPAYWG